MTKDVRSVDLNELPMRIAKSSNKCFKDYVILIYVNSNVTSKKLVEIIPILSFRVYILNIMKDIKWSKSKRTYIIKYWIIWNIEIRS